MLRAQCVRMKRVPAAALALAMTAGTFPVACDNDGTVREAETPPAAERGIARAGEPLSGSPTQPPPDVGARPAHVYNVLTEFDWYARGEPVVLDGTSYTLAGDPVRIDARTLARVAEYGGVDLYRRDGDPDVYIPVFDGYWLGFAADPNVPLPTAPADTTMADTMGATR